jgi:hypothetical protein
LWTPSLHSCGDCICEHGFLFASAAIFDSEKHFPSDYVAAEPNINKKCHKIKGAAGPEFQRFLQAARADKKQEESKIKYMELEGPAGQVVIPEVVFPTSSDSYKCG